MADVEKLEKEVAELKKLVSDLQRLVLSRMTLGELQNITGKKLSIDDLKDIGRGNPLTFSNLMFTPPELDD